MGKRIAHLVGTQKKSRWLVNAGGALMKFDFGAMDEKDRQNFEEYQRVLDEKNHQLI